MKADYLGEKRQYRYRNDEADNLMSKEFPKTLRQLTSEKRLPSPV
jgi:hypothetical protein